jgi:hypothetical protein
MKKRSAFRADFTVFDKQLRKINFKRIFKQISEIRVYPRLKLNFPELLKIEAFTVKKAALFGRVRSLPEQFRRAR